MLPPLFFSVRLPTLLAIWCARFRAKTVQASRKEPSFLVVRLDSMGDVVLTSPLFRALKEANPKARISVAVQPAYRSLLVTNPYVDEVLSPPDLKPKWLPHGVARLFAALMFYRTELRKRRFDYAISPRWDVDEHLATMLCVLSNAPHRVGYTCRTSVLKARANAGFDSVYDICLPAGPVQHEVKRNLAIADAMGAPNSSRNLDIRITDKDRTAVSRLLASARNRSKPIAVGIGAASEGRRWPLSRYAAVLQELAPADDLWPVIVCSREELEDAQELHAFLGARATIVCGAPLRELCAVLERCELFIGNDSGCAHLAAAMGCKTIVISRHPVCGDPNHFNSPVRFAPWGTDVKVAQPAAIEVDCKSACIIVSPHCILNVSVEEVVRDARRLLDLDSIESSRRMKPWGSATLRMVPPERGVSAVHHTADGRRIPTNGPSL